MGVIYILCSVSWWFSFYLWNVMFCYFSVRGTFWFLMGWQKACWYAISSLHFELSNISLCLYFYSSSLASIFYGIHRCFTIIISGSLTLAFCKLQSHFWIGSHYSALPTAELTMYISFQRNLHACLCLSNDGIKDLYHLTLFLLGFLSSTTTLVMSYIHHIVK